MQSVVEDAFIPDVHRNDQAEQFRAIVFVRTQFASIDHDESIEGEKIVVDEIEEFVRKSLVIDDSDRLVIVQIIENEVLNVVSRNTTDAAEDKTNERTMKFVCFRGDVTLNRSSWKCK